MLFTMLGSCHASGPDHDAPCNHVLAQYSSLHLQNQYELYCMRTSQQCRQCNLNIGANKFAYYGLSALFAQWKCGHVHHKASLVICILCTKQV